MKKKSQMSFSNIGLSLLLVALIAICLSTFAVLSFVSAKNDYNLSLQVEKQRTAYYQANNKAEEILSSIDNSYYKDKKVPASYTFEDGEVISITNDLGYVSYSVMIDSSNVLQVELDITTSPAITINKWQTVSTDDWNGDSTLTVVE